MPRYLGDAVHPLPPSPSPLPPQMALQDLEHLRRISWRVMVCDEAQRLKNSTSKMYTGLLSLRSGYRLLLTGTPIQNNLAEMWSLLHFLDDKAFESEVSLAVGRALPPPSHGSLPHPSHILSRPAPVLLPPFCAAPQEDFLAEYGDLESHERVVQLQQLISPYLLRRLKVSAPTLHSTAPPSPTLPPPFDLSHHPSFPFLPTSPSTPLRATWRSRSSLCARLSLRFSSPPFRRFVSLFPSFSRFRSSATPSPTSARSRQHPVNPFHPAPSLTSPTALLPCGL